MRIPFTIAAASLSLTATPVLAQAASQAAAPCVTTAEFASLVGYAMPSVIAGATKRCATTLDSRAYLRTESSALSARYSAHKTKAWPAAKAAFMKITGSDNDKASAVLRDLPDPTLQQMLDGVVEGMVAQEVPLKDCGTIDRFVRLLAPLPPENTAEIVGLAVGLASKEKKGATAAASAGKLGKLNICQSPS